MAARRTRSVFNSGDFEMPIEKSGSISLAYSGLPMHQALPMEIQEMRKELRHMERVLNIIEGQARAKVPAAAMKPQFSALYNWNLSVMESFFAMISIAFNDLDPNLSTEIARDYVKRFSMLTA
jgi:hypothetical protein